MASLISRVFLLLSLPLATVAAQESPAASKEPAAPASTPSPAPAAPAPTGEGDTIHAPPKIEWEKIAELPPRHGEGKNPGLAGAFAGAQGDALIIAGGTNYPQGTPWTGAKRSLYNDIYVLERAGAGGAHTYQWVDPQAQLPEALAYGAAVSLPDGVLCTGGATADAARDTCFLLSWDKGTRKVSVTPFPKLPRPLACHAAAVLKNVVYIIGGTQQAAGGRATSSFYSLDLSKRNDPNAFQWKALTPWDGPSRIFPVVATGSDGGTESLYLCGGRDPGSEPDFLIDLHRYNPVKKDWSVLGDVVDRKGQPGYVMATAAFLVPPHHLVVVGGMDAEITKLLERNGRDLKDLDATERDRRQKYETWMLENFPGYPRTVRGYDAVIGEWNSLGSFPADVPLTNPAVNWDTQIVIPGGETGPGKRTPDIWAATVHKKPLLANSEPVSAPDNASDVPPPGEIPASAPVTNKPLAGGKPVPPNKKPKPAPKPVRKQQPVRPAGPAPESFRPGPPRPDSLPRP